MSKCSVLVRFVVTCLVAAVAQALQGENVAKPDEHRTHLVESEERQLATKLLELNVDSPEQLIARLRALEGQDPLTVDREFATVVLSCVQGGENPDADEVLLDWLEFRLWLGVQKNQNNPDNSQLYPVVDILKKRGTAIVSRLLDHATRAPRSKSYAWRARHLLREVIPDKEKRREAIQDYAIEHPGRKDSLELLAEPIRPKLTDEEFFHLLENPLPEQLPDGSWGDTFVSVGQWKRLHKK